MTHRHDSRTIIQQLQIPVPDELTAVVDRYHPDCGPVFFSGYLPGYDVRMMLDLRKDNFIPLGKKFLAETMGHQVDSIGSSRGVDNLMFMFRVDKPLNFPAGCFKGVCRLLTQVMNSPVYIGMLAAVVVI